MSEEYNPFLDEPATPNEEDFTHVPPVGNGPGSHTSENGAVSSNSLGDKVCLYTHLFLYPSLLSNLAMFLAAGSRDVCKSWL